MLFVTQSTHDELQLRHNELLNQWNSLVKSVNKQGGTEFLSGKKHRVEIAKLQNASFSDEELRSLVQLCHPDRHNGKESAHKMTAKLNMLRNR